MYQNVTYTCTKYGKYENSGHNVFNRHFSLIREPSNFHLLIHMKNYFTLWWHKKVAIKCEKLCYQIFIQQNFIRIKKQLVKHYDKCLNLYRNYTKGSLKLYIKICATLLWCFHNGSIFYIAVIHLQWIQWTAVKNTWKHSFVTLTRQYRKMNVSHNLHMRMNH